MFEPYLLALLELTFILIVLMLLHRLHEVIGNAPFYLTLGAVIVYGQFVTASGIQISHEIPALAIMIGPVVFIAPLMAILLITYVVDGTLVAQRLIWAIIFMAGAAFYLTYLTERQVLNPGHIVNTDVFFSNQGVSALFHGARTFILASLLSVLLEFLILPVIYEILRYRGFGVSVCVTGALVLSQAIDVFFFMLVTDPMHQFWWDKARHVFIIRAAAMLWLSVLTIFYLRLRHARHTHEASSRRPLDMVVAFLGSYSRAEKLQANLREWEGRYRLIFDKSHDLIFLVGEDGMIIDVNDAAISACGYSTEELHQMNIGDLMLKPFDWSSQWRKIFDKLPFENWKIINKVARCEATLKGVTGEQIILEASMTPLFIQQHHGILFVGRDVTSRRELENELVEKQDQLIHSQRMEAVGTLAGGIAHDFNNLLHAIQGSVDSLEKERAGNERVQQLTKNISGAIKRASGLTSQLLGFARAGKYKVEKILLNQLVEDVEQLFLPLAGRRVKFRVVIHPDPMMVEGDSTQLQQVLLNLLLNARDALPDEDGRIICRAEPATEHTEGIERRTEGTSAENYVVVRVKDNGSGMDDATIAKIFEPFYTTKGASGTGMGLAMAYGCLENHGGWINVKSEVGKGTEFSIFLPMMTD